MTFQDILPFANFVAIVIGVGVYIGTLRSTMEELERKVARIESAYSLLAKQMMDTTSRLARIEGVLRESLNTHEEHRL
jgi:archaellum component FlaC